MASEFELIAALIGEDRFFVEVDEYGFGDLLKEILRTCHDLNNEKYDATWLADEIASLITGYVGVKHWPEEEGSGPTLWEDVDAPKLEPGEVNPVTGEYNPGEDQLDLTVTEPTRQTDVKEAE